MVNKWDRKYASASNAGSAAAVLNENQHLLPVSGNALDIACGLGANAMLLASKGLTAHAWDASSVAIDLLLSFAAQRELPVTAAVRDVIANPPIPDDCWDIVVVSHFLDRVLCSQISDSLAPGGLLFYQTYTQSRVSAGGPGNPEYLLQENELLALFSGLIVRYYREEGVQGDTQQGYRNQAYLVGQKPLVAQDEGVAG
jgi:tellurite methyltransferase